MKKCFAKRGMVKRILAGIFCILLFVTSLQAGLTAFADTLEAITYPTAVIDGTAEEVSYEYFLGEKAKVGFADEDVVIGVDKLTSTYAEGQTAEEVEGKQALVLSESKAWVEYTFEVTETAIYNLLVDYCPVKDTGRAIQLGFVVDGEYPYSELSNVNFSRIWVNENDDMSKNVDAQGNQVRPPQIEKFRWNQEWVESATGMFNIPYAIYLEEGTHTLRVVRHAESIAISTITLTEYELPISYKEYKKANSDKKVGAKDYRVEAETAFEKSDNRLGATIDNTNSGMYPLSSTTSVVNSFGKDYWTMVGQWASWKAPSNLKEGMYVLRFRVKQNAAVGISTFRKLTINGKVPFEEAASIKFEYNDGWYIATAGGDKPYEVYLEPGDVLTLEATTGVMSDALRDISKSVEKLNSIYQSIIMVTGTTPDTERDYNIQREIPTLMDDLKAVRKDIAKIEKQMVKIMGEANSKTYLFREFADVLDGMIENYRTIVEELATFKSYIDSYVAQTYDFNTLGLEIDTIHIMNPKSEAPKAGAGFFKGLSFEFKRFVYSFADKYETKETNGKKTITIWTGLGRDQAQAVTRLIESEFKPQHPEVNVKLVMSATSLGQAILAGLEPDIMLSVVQTDPINYALRGQVLDIKPYLDKFEKTEEGKEMLSQYEESAWIPFQYKGGTYAFPMTQSFNVMFYRTDILNSLGLEAPNTWDEFYDVLRELQKNKFQIGIKETDAANAGVTAAGPVFNMFLYQRGGQYYNDSLTQTNFESKEGKEAFLQLVELYRDYQLQTDFDITSRFRSGEMPIFIAGYETYQQISAIATEIQGRWAMTTVPGTVKEDGTIDKTVTATVTGTMILKGAKERGVADEAFEFVKWWASASTQQNYSFAMEAIQGVAGRVAVANTTAFENVGWSTAEKVVLREQRESTVGVPEIPGNYIILRHLTNALRASYDDGADPLRQLNIQSRFINQELKRKRAEFEDSN